MSKRGHECVDPFHDERLLARDVLKVDILVVGAEQPCVKDYLDPELMELPDGTRTGIAVQLLARHLAIDREPHTAATSREHLRDSEANPVRCPIRNHHSCADICLAANNRPSIDDVCFALPLDRRS